MFTLRLLAQQPAANPFDRPEIIWGTAGLAGALLVGAVVVLLVDRWRKKGLAPPGKSVDELTEYRKLFDSGEITEEEYKRLRAQLAERVSGLERRLMLSSVPGEAALGEELVAIARAARR